MPESLQHRQLVTAIGTWAKARFGMNGGLYLLVDSGERARQEAPWRIDGYVPDLLVGTCPRTFTLIGEAKCNGDLETERTSLQMRAFLSYLRTEEDPYFVLATAPALIPTARRLLVACMREVQAARVQCFLISSAGPAVNVGC